MYAKNYMIAASSNDSCGCDKPKSLETWLASKIARGYGCSD